jgi:hypothetical protein
MTTNALINEYNRIMARVRLEGEPSERDARSGVLIFNELRSRGYGLVNGVWVDELELNWRVASARAHKSS